jgi:uncharacterized protein
MIGGVIVDTGPLLALLDRRDQFHAWVRARFAEIVPPLLTCEAVLTETCYLARRLDGGTHAALDLLDRDVIRLAFGLDENLAPVVALMRRYANVPMSLADACLVRMSELCSDGAIFTLDSDFQVYRRHKRQKIPLLIPPGR